jgi:hypothetical protein
MIVYQATRNDISSIIISENLQDAIDLYKKASGFEPQKIERIYYEYIIVEGFKEPDKEKEDLDFPF